MKKFLAPVILFILAAGIVAYLFLDFSGTKSSFDADAYLNVRAKIDSLEIALWESADKPNEQMTIRAELDSSWAKLNSMRVQPVVSGASGNGESVGDSAAKISGETLVWIIGGAAAVIVCVILLVALGHRKKVLTQKMEAVKSEQRFREPKNGFENDATILVPRPHPQKKSIIDEVVGNPDGDKANQKISFEDENGVVENKILSADPDAKPTLRPTAKERITSAMQSLSDVLRAPRGISRNRTISLRVQSYNAVGTPPPEQKDPRKTSRFDKAFTEKNKILQMSRRGFPASAIAAQLGLPQDQVENVIKESLESGT